MSETCETVQISDPKAPGGFVEINKEDFDEKKHKLYDASSPEPNPALRGKLPDNFPGLAALNAEGYTSYAQVRKAMKDDVKIQGIADATKAKIREALAAKPEAEDES